LGQVTPSHGETWRKEDSMIDGMAEAKAHEKARIHSKHGLTRYVVYEGGEWSTASDYDMDTFYAGNQPVACYVDGKRDS